MHAIPAMRAVRAMRARTVAIKPARVLMLEHTLGRALHVGERAFVLLALSAFCGTLPLLLGRASVLMAGASDVKLKAVIMVPIYLTAGALLLVRPGAAAGAIRRNLPVVALLAMVAASTLWSDVPALTLRRAASLGATFLVGLYFATRLPARALLELVAGALGIVAVASLAYVVLRPDQGIAPAAFAGAWRGIYPHKQMLGIHMALGTVAFVVLALGRARYRWGAWLGAALCAGLLIRSRSISALIVTLAALAAVPLLHVLRRRNLGAMAAGLFGLVALTGVVVSLVAQVDTVLTAVGKNDSLTGRLPLWRFVLERIGDRPMLGYGYFGFWTGWNGPSRGVRQVMDNWYPWHAHNGLLQLSLDLGAIGLLLFLTAYLAILSRGLLALTPAARAERLWPPAYLVFLLLVSTDETVLLQPNTIFTVLFAAVAFARSAPEVCRTRPRREAGVPAAGRAGRDAARTTLGRERDP